MRQNHTIQKRMILEVLREMNTHPTADELYDAVRLRLPRISLRTVYRNLSILAESGLVFKLSCPGMQTRYDAMQKPHFHLRCEKCGKIEDIPISAELYETAKKMFLSEIGPRVHSFQLEFNGLCIDCADAGTPKN